MPLCGPWIRASRGGARCEQGEGQNRPSRGQNQACLERDLPYHEARYASLTGVRSTARMGMHHGERPMSTNIREHSWWSLGEASWWSVACWEAAVQRAVPGGAGARPYRLCASAANPPGSCSCPGAFAGGGPSPAAERNAWADEHDAEEVQHLAPRLPTRGNCQDGSGAARGRGADPADHGGA